MQNKQLIIGLAGLMASGKNVVADILAKKGFLVIDVDILGHEALELQREVIINTFLYPATQQGISLVNPNGTINRKELAKIVFADKKQLQKLEDIVHPQINALITKIIAENSAKDIVINAAILHKFEIITKCSFILFIDAPFLIRALRIKKRDSLSFGAILRRNVQQKKIYAKCKKLNADIYKVRNWGTQKYLERRIHTILQSISHKG